MGKIEVQLPKMGESVAEATITKWLKQEGEHVEAEELLVEIATDKVDSEVPAPESGVISKILAKEGEVVKVGDVIVEIATEGEEKVGASKAEQAESPAPAAARESIPQPEPAIAEQQIAAPVAGTEINKTSPSGKFFSPLVRNIAKKEGISMQELETIQGSGASGRVTKRDILEYLPERNGQQKAPQAESIAEQTAPTPPLTAEQTTPPSTSFNGEVEIIEMDRMRKLIADHMVMSKRVSPHVTSYVEADVTNIVLWRNKVKQKFQDREGEKITFTPIFIDAVVKALKDYPMVNVSVEGTRIIKKLHINIGMAAALPSGNLIVPVIKDADRMNLIGLTKTVNDLANRARNNKLRPDEIQGGTFTITNVGTFGNVMGTPIINQPQAAILATGTIQKKPAVIETPQGDTIGIRHMMFLSLSYDHRVVDGALGGSYLRKVADYLEGFDINTVI